MQEFEVTFEDNGIHNAVIQKISAIDMDHVDVKAKAKLKRLVAANRLHQDHAYVAIVRRVDR